MLWNGSGIKSIAFILNSKWGKNLKIAYEYVKIPNNDFVFLCSLLDKYLNDDIVGGDSAFSISSIQFNG